MGSKNETDKTDAATTFTKKLPVNIDPKDKDERNTQLIAVLQKVESVGAEKASAVSGFNAELKQLRKEQHKLVSAIASGEEQRDVECFERFDYRRGIVQTVRMDTDSIIDERAMTVDERQEDIPGIDGGASAATEADDANGAGETVAHYPPGSKAKRKRKGATDEAHA